MCPDTVRHDELRWSTGGGEAGHPGAPRGSGEPATSSLRSSDCSFPRTTRSPFCAVDLAVQSVTHVPGQKCHPCSRLHRPRSRERGAGMC